MPLYQRGGSSGSALPATSPGKVLGTNESGDLVWVDQGESPFRGAWTEDEVVASYGFTGGLAPWTVTNSGTGTGAAVSAVTPPSSPYTNSAYMRFASGTSTSRWVQLTLDLVALGIPNLTKARFLYRPHGATGNAETYNEFRGLVNGVQSLTYAPPLDSVDWVESELSLGSTPSTLAFRSQGILGSVGTEVGWYVTGIRLYASGDPYMLGDFVTHAGEMWRSLIDNNTQQPSPASTSWERALTLPPPAGTTAIRPNADDAGAGFMYFDTTLNKPIWSNGTVWVDATGATV
jgi:hypothetical protein